MLRTKIAVLNSCNLHCWWLQLCNRMFYLSGFHEQQILLVTEHLLPCSLWPIEYSVCEKILYQTKNNHHQYYCSCCQYAICVDARVLCASTNHNKNTRTRWAAAQTYKNHNCTLKVFLSLCLVYLHIWERMHHLLHVIRVEAYVIMQHGISHQGCCGWPWSHLAKKTCT